VAASRDALTASSDETVKTGTYLRIYLGDPLDSNTNSGQSEVSGISHETVKTERSSLEAKREAAMAEVMAHMESLKTEALRKVQVSSHPSLYEYTRSTYGVPDREGGCKCRTRASPAATAKPPRRSSRLRGREASH
jgi:hypothetical protein